MIERRPLPGFAVVALYALGAAALAVLLIRTGASDMWLYLLVGPVLLAAAFYPRGVYLLMCVGTLLAAAAVILHRSPEGGGRALRNLWLAIALILINSELLHRMLQARLRAEAKLRQLLGREQEARAEALAARERFAFLAASDSLAGSLDLPTTLAQVARQAVPYLADVCTVRLAAEGGAGERWAGAHADPAKEPLLEALRDGYGLDLGLRSDGEAVLRGEISEEALCAAARDEEHARLLRELHPRSAILVPLARQGQELGSVTFLMTDSGRRYAPEHLELAKELARRGAIAMENARLHQELRQADRGKMEFLAMLGHELRNPLAAISNAGYLLEQPGTGVARVSWLVGMITRQTAHLARLVDDLLEVSRITHGKLKLRREPIEIVAASQQAVESVRPLLEERRHELHLALPDAPIWVDADPTRYEQVLVNLLSNAAKYTPDGGQIRVSVALTHTEGGIEPSGSDLSSMAPRSVAIRVRDSGIGITPHLLPHVFDLFTQGDASPAGPRSGLGIGLTLVRRLVELHGGCVSAWSEGPGRGSEFTLTLPIAQCAAEEPQPGRHLGPPFRDVPAPGAPRGVLIVDDDRDAAETLAEVLEMWGHQVWVARSGVRGIEMAEAHQPNVALLDIGMPGMNGYEVARSLRAGTETRGMVLVALTGYGADEDRQQSREAGFDYHLVKPADPEELRRLLIHVSSQMK